MIIRIEIRVEEVTVAVHHEIPRINHQINQGRMNNVIIMIVEIRLVIQKLLLQKKGMIRKSLLPKMARPITKHNKKMENQKMVLMIVRLRQDGIEIRIRHQDGVTETSMAAVVVDDEEIEIVHEVDHAVANGIDHIVENVIEIGRVGQTGTVDDLIVHIIITGRDLDHVKGQGREVGEEVTIIIIEGLPDQIGIDDHTVGQGHVNVDLEVGRRSLRIIEAVVAVAVGGEIDQDQ